MKQLLVCDDEILLREMLSDYLTSKGYKVAQAKNGKECIEQASSGDWDAILMDIRMPELGGIEALDYLRNHGIKIPIILMSGFSSLLSIKDAKNRGANDLITKPFDLKHVLEAIQDAS